MKRRPFFMSGIRSIFILMAGAFLGTAAFAHDPGLSSAHVVRTGQGVEIVLALSWSDLASLDSAALGPIRPNEAALLALGPGLGKAAGGLVKIYANQNLIDGTVPVIAPGFGSPTEVLISLRWPEVPASAVQIDFPILNRTPFGHRMMLTLGNALEPTGLLDARHQTWELPASPEHSSTTPVHVVQPTHVSWVSFIGLGVEHILTGFDHLCFLLALLLVAPCLRDVIKVVTTFTVAHSLTLAAAALGTFSLSSSIVEPLIAASIVYIGLENIFIRRQPRYRLAVVFGFGLIHGLGFASGLTERLPGITGFAVVPPLLGFNAGVELGQLAVAACLVPVIVLARNRPAFFGRLQPACSFMIATAGLVWLLQRV